MNYQMRNHCSNIMKNFILFLFTYHHLSFPNVLYHICGVVSIIRHGQRLFFGVSYVFISYILREI